MILYHGSNGMIDAIDLRKCRPYKDFGRGFYLTPDRAQAERMANRVTRIYGGHPVVHAYEFDETQIASLNVKRFEHPQEEWAVFVMNNRNRYFNNPSDLQSNHDNKYDLVVGPIANDDLALLFRQFASGMITTEILVREMQYKKLTVQFSFHTERAISLLKQKGVWHE